MRLRSGDRGVHWFGRMEIAFCVQSAKQQFPAPVIRNIGAMHSPVHHEWRLKTWRISENVV